MDTLLIDIVALLVMLPLGFMPFRRAAIRDVPFWAALAVAVLGPLIASLAHLSGEWSTGLAQTLWVSVAVSMGLYGVFNVWDSQAWRLSPILVPYLFLMGALATLFEQFGAAPMVGTAPNAWIIFHILVSVMTYGLLTLAAVAGGAAFLSERALKRKQPTALTRVLPSVADSEGLATRLLAAAELVLGLGLISGMAVQFFETGSLLRFDHKTLLSFLAFIVIGALLLARHYTGVRGRSAARFILLAYLLLTLGFPGVKFVSQVLLG